MDALDNECQQKIIPLKKEEAELRKFIMDRNSNISDLEYSALLILNKRLGRENNNLKDFYGKIQIKFYFKSLKAADIQENQINLEKSLFINFQGIINKVFINGKLVENIDQSTDNNKLFIDMKYFKDDKDNFITIFYSGSYTRLGRGLHYFKDPEDDLEYLYSQFEPFDCHRVFPCFDQPDLKAKLTLNVMAMDDWLVFSNEDRIPRFDYESSHIVEVLDCINSYGDKNTLEENKNLEIAENMIFLKDIFLNLSNKNVSEWVSEKFIKDLLTEIRYKLHTFSQTQKISCYLFALCVGSYHECRIDNSIREKFLNLSNKKENIIENKEEVDLVFPQVRIFCRQSKKEYVYTDEMCFIVYCGMEFYQNYFGCKFPFSKYDQFLVPEFNFVAMENVGLVTFDDALFTFLEKPRKINFINFAIIILHELSHMWFGNLITMKWWDDLWLNESFATFISFLCLENSIKLNEKFNFNFSGWEYFSFCKDCAYTSDKLITTHPIVTEIKDTFMAENNFDDLTYEKGSAVLKQLYKFLGDQQFSKKLKTYFKKYQWQNTTFNEFIQVLSSNEQEENIKNNTTEVSQELGIN